jgi:hypothetical protein
MAEANTRASGELILRPCEKPRRAKPRRWKPAEQCRQLHRGKWPQSRIVPSMALNIVPYMALDIVPRMAHKPRGVQPRDSIKSPPPFSRSRFLAEATIQGKLLLRKAFRRRKCRRCSPLGKAHLFLKIGTRIGICSPSSHRHRQPVSLGKSSHPSVPAHETQNRSALASP